MNTFLQKQNRRFRNAFRGFIVAAKMDNNFKLQLFGSLFFAGFGYVMWPLTETELFFLILAFVLIIITELQNTSFETALDRIHPEQHDYIGKSKDMAASAVLMAGIFALVIVSLIFIRHI
jgi:undecaprenol kinase